MREDVTCAHSADGLHTGVAPVPVHYTGSTLIEAFGETRSVAAWAYLHAESLRSLLRRLNAFAMLEPEFVMSLPRCIRIRDVPLGAPRSWTWDALPWDADHFAQAWVDAHPGGATLEEVGDALGVTRERVRQIETVGLRKVRRAARSQGVPVLEMLETLRELRDKRAPVAL